MNAAPDSTRSRRIRDLLASVAVLAAALSLSAAPAAHATCSPDTVVVYGPTQFTGAGTSTWHIVDDEFSTTTSWGRRYLVEVVNGITGVNQLIVSLDGQQWIGSSEGANVTRIIDVADGNQTHALTVAVKGTTSSYVTLRISHVFEPCFTIYGPTTFTWPSVPATQSFSFTAPAGAKPPYALRVINGDGDGFNRITNGYIKLNGSKIVNAFEFGTGIATISRQVTLLSGGQPDSVIMSSSAPAGSLMSLRFTATDSTAPALTVTSPAEGLVTEANQVSVAGSVVDETPVTVTIIPGGTPIQTNTTFSQNFAMASDGNYTITVQAKNSACLSTDSVRHVARDTQAPSLTVNRPGVPFAAVDSTYLTVSGSWADTIMTYITVDGDTVASGKSGTFALPASYPLDLGPNRIVIRATDILGHETTVTRHVFRGQTNDIGRDSSLVLTLAGTLPETEITSFLDQVKFLYTPTDSIQKDVTPDSIKPYLAAVVHGHVTSRDFGSLPRVRVEVLGREEFGYTLTGRDGKFDMVVNGGAPLTLRFRKEGYLEVQRTLTPQLNDFALIDSLAMIGKTAKVSTVNLATGAFIRGRFKSDANGDRDIRLYFPPSESALVVVDSDTTILASTVHVRATEYTVGSDARNAMPALLPPGSAYTYCVDLSLDEADALAQESETGPEVLFTKPVISYVRNFLQFAPGTRIPAGRYDTKRAQWIGMQDGIVLRILSAIGDSVTIDSNNDGQADSQTLLDSLQISIAERVQLAHQYGANDVIWRVPLKHFSTSDDNINMEQVAAQQSVTAGRAGQPSGLVEDPCHATGSIIECENRVLGQRVPIVGTPFDLNYRSFRARGDVAIRTLQMRVTGDTVPAGVQRIIVLLDVAGKRYRQEFAASANRSVTIPWDGKDLYGRTVQGSVDALVSVGFQYPVQYVSSGSSSGGGFSDGAGNDSPIGPAGADRAVGRVAWARRRVSLGAPSAGSAGLGNWTISPHHFYDLTGRGALYFGDGSVQLGERNYPLIFTAYPSIAATDVAIGPDGAVYISTISDIWRLVDGELARVAGTTGAGAYIDNVQATTSPLTNPRQLTVGPDGSIYFVMASESECNCQRVCKITPDGIVRSIAGDGVRHGGRTGDDGPATSAGFAVPYSIALGPDGSVFVGDRETYTVRRIRPNGIINTVAGTGSNGGAGNGATGTATQIPISTPTGLCVDAEGNLFIAEPENKRIRRVGPDGTITTAAYLDATWFYPNDVALGPDGSIYVASGTGNDATINRLYQLDPDGTLTQIAGGGPLEAPYTNDDIPALGAGFANPIGIAVSPDGSIYFAAGPVRRVAAALPGNNGSEFAVPSADASEIYFFDLTGRHLRTKDALTGATLFTFTYGAENRLHAIYDVNGDSTVITRDGSQNPTSIVAPFGQTTTLSVDGYGLLDEIENPAGEAVTLENASDGLMNWFKDAKEQQHTFDYADDGRLERDTDPTTAYQTLNADSIGVRRQVTRRTGENHAFTYKVIDLADGTRQRRTIAPDGSSTAMSDSSDGQVRLRIADGTMFADSLARDPRFGMLAPMAARQRIELPSTLARRLATSRIVDPPGFDPPATHGGWTQVDNLNGSEYVTAYHSSNRALTIRTPEQRETRLMLDPLGRMTSAVVAGVDSVVLAYDGHGHVIHAAQGSRAWRYTYNAKGLLASVTDTLNRATTFQYDLADRESIITLPGNRVVAIDYDVNGNVTEIRPPGNTVHAFDYTPVDLNESYTPPTVAGISNPATTYEFNDDRLLTRVERPDTVFTLDYDASGRLEEIQHSQGVNVVTYTTNPSTGQARTLTGADGTVLTRDYDGPLLKKETWSGTLSGSVERTFDRWFRDSTEKVNGGSQVAFLYDDDGLLVGAGTMAVERRSSDGLITGTTAGVVTSELSYNSLGELTDLHYKVSGTTYFRQQLYRDGLGRIIRIGETVDGQSHSKVFRYDAAGRLDSVAVDSTHVAAYRYDENQPGNGNRTLVVGSTALDTVGATYDAQDRMLRYGPDAYRYTDNGELRKITRANGDSTLFRYDVFGNLIRVKPPGHQIDYVVDGRNRRVGYKVDGVLQRLWLYRNGLNPVAELDRDGDLVTRYVYGTRGHVPDLMLKESTGYRVVTDYLGSARAVVDTTNGTAAQRIDYDPWGVRTTDTAPDFQTLGFAGGLTDSATLHIRFGARDYGPGTGRWTAKEPSPFLAWETNLQAYADGDPVNWIDPQGLSRDTYHADTRGHGGPHVDRKTPAGELVGRYRLDGSPIPHFGRKPPPVPRADLKRFSQVVTTIIRWLERRGASQLCKTAVPILGLLDILRVTEPDSVSTESDHPPTRR